jgi:hypothetical protein
MENWKDIPGYEGIYQVSDQGNVRSLDRCLVRSTGVTFTLKGVQLKPSVVATRGFYRQVILCVDGVPKARRVSGLVAGAFIGLRPKDYDVCHNDGDPQNDCLSNLRYGTRKENMTDTLVHGTRRRGPVAATKLSAEAVLEIRALPKGKGLSLIHI